MQYCKRVVGQQIIILLYRIPFIIFAVFGVSFATTNGGVMSPRYVISCRQTSFHVYFCHFIAQNIWDDINIFKMLGVRHVQFSKFAILITWPVPVSDSASSYQSWRQPDKNSLRCSQITLFQMPAVRRFECAKLWFFVRWPFSESKHASAQQI